MVFSPAGLYPYSKVTTHLCEKLCVLYDYRYGIFVCKCVSVSECKFCYIIYVVVQRAKRKTAVAILVPQFSYFNFHMNFSCKRSVYIYMFSLYEN